MRRIFFILLLGPASVLLFVLMILTELGRAAAAVAKPIIAKLDDLADRAAAAVAKPIIAKLDDLADRAHFDRLS